MQDNTKRANRVLFWMKAIIVLFAVFWLHFIFVIASIVLVFSFALALFAGMYLYAFTFLFIVGIFIALVLFCINYLSWLHRAVTNLRLLTTTKFSPVGAVLLTCIPFFGYFLNYFIISDMVKSQERYMEQRGILKERFPKRILNVWFIASLALLILVVVDPKQFGFLTVVFTTFELDKNQVFEFLETTLIVIIPILYVMSFSAYAKQESKLFRIHTEELFNKRVDEVIREREIMRAAEMLRKSQGSESCQTPQDLHSK
jgi:hypothetical protein